MTSSERSLNVRKGRHMGHNFKIGDKVIHKKHSELGIGTIKEIYNGTIDEAVISFENRDKAWITSLKMHHELYELISSTPQGAFFYDANTWKRGKK